MSLMKKNVDAFGQEILAYFEGKESCEIVERNDGLVSLSEAPKSYFGKYRVWPKWQKKAIKFAKGRVLDISCGAGRVGLYLQQKNFDVTSIDISPLAIQICKKRRLKKAFIRSIEEAHKFKYNSFDTIIMFGNNFGLFGNFNSARKLLKEFYRITSNNALIIAETMDPYKTDDNTHLKYQRLNRKVGRMPGQIKIRIRFKNYIGNWFDYLLVSENELNHILQNTGWIITKIISSGDSFYLAIIGKSNKL